MDDTKIYLLLYSANLFTFVNVWFLLYTIKPHRKMIQEDVNEEAGEDSAEDINAVVV